MTSASTDKILASGKSPLRLLAACGIVAPVFFTAVVITLGSIQPGYNHVAQPISELGEVGAPNAVVQDINFVVLGVLSLAFAFGIHRGMNGGKGSRIGPSLVALFGVLTVGEGTFFPCDPGCRFTTLTGTLHDVFGLTSFVAFTVAPLILSRRLKTDGQWQSYRSYSLVTGLLMIVFFIAYMAANVAIPALRGGTQRLLVGAFLLWMEVIAIRLFRISSPLSRPADTQHHQELPSLANDDLQGSPLNAFGKWIPHSVFCSGLEKRDS